MLVEFIEVIKDNEVIGEDESDIDKEKAHLQQSERANESALSRTREEKMHIYDDIDKDFSDVAKLSPKEQMNSLITRKRARTTTT